MDSELFNLFVFMENGFITKNRILDDIDLLLNLIYYLIKKKNEKETPVCFQPQPVLSKPVVKQKQVECRKWTNGMKRKSSV